MFLLECGKLLLSPELRFCSLSVPHLSRPRCGLDAPRGRARHTRAQSA